MSDREAVFHAIAIMRERENDPDNVGHEVHRLVASYLAEPNGDFRLINGLISLSGWLLLKVQNATDNSAEQILQEIAAKLSQQ